MFSIVQARIRFSLDKGSLAAVKTQAQADLGGIQGKIRLDVDPRTQAQLDKLAGTFGRLKASVKELEAAAGSAAVGVDRLAAASQRAAARAAAAADASGRTAAAVRQTGAAATAAANAFTEFGRRVGLAATRFLAFTVAAGALFAVTRAFREGLRGAVEFDLQLNKLRQVSGEAAGTVRGVGDEVMRLSTTLGASSKDLMEAAVTLKQAGLATRDVKTALEGIAQASLAPNFSSVKQITEGAIASYQQFGRSVTDLKDRLGAMNAVAGDFAAEAADLVTAVQKAGGVASQTGMQFNELLAVFTSIRSTTRESADSIATGLRTIFSRLQRPETVEALKGLNVQLRHTREEAAALGDLGLEDQFVGGYEAVRRLSEELGKFRTTDPRFAMAMEELGGYRQIGRVIPMVQQFGEAQKALNVARVGGASLDAAAATRQDALATKLAKVREEWAKFMNTLAQSKAFRDTVDVLGTLATGLVHVLDALKPLLPMLVTLATVKLAQGAGAFAYGLMTPGGFGRKGDNQPPPPWWGRRLGFSAGGHVPGVGDGDTVPAQLEPGEFVIKKSSARRLGPRVLQEMNASGRAPRQRYATGGRVFHGIPVYGDPPTEAGLAGMEAGAAELPAGWPVLVRGIRSYRRHPRREALENHYGAVPFATPGGRDGTLDVTAGGRRRPFFGDGPTFADAVANAGRGRLMGAALREGAFNDIGGITHPGAALLMVDVARGHAGIAPRLARGNRREVGRFLNHLLGRETGAPLTADERAMLRAFTRTGDHTAALAAADSIQERGHETHAQLLQALIRQGARYGRYATGGEVDPTGHGDLPSADPGRLHGERDLDRAYGLRHDFLRAVLPERLRGPDPARFRVKGGGNALLARLGVRRALALSGATPDATGSVRTLGDEVHVEAEGTRIPYEMGRVIYPGPRGVQVYNAELTVPEEHRKSGVGTAVYLRQLQAMARGKTDLIRLLAAGDPQAAANGVAHGYKVWPLKFGVDAPVGALFGHMAKVVAAVSPEARSLQEYLKAPGAAAAWAAHGKSFKGHLFTGAPKTWEAALARLAAAKAKGQLFAAGGAVRDFRGDNAGAWDHYFQAMQRLARAGVWGGPVTAAAARYVASSTPYNSFLGEREPGDAVPPPMARDIGHLSRFLAAARLPDAHALYRGVNARNLAWMAARLGVRPTARAAAGREFVAPGFTSLSLDPQVTGLFAGGDGARMRVVVPGGAKVAPVGNLDQLEYVAAPRSRYRILGHDPDGTIQTELVAPRRYAAGGAVAARPPLVTQEVVERIIARLGKKTGVDFGKLLSGVVVTESGLAGRSVEEVRELLADKFGPKAARGPLPNGSYDRDTGVLSVNPNNFKTLDGLTYTLAHELGHAVDHRVFGRGGRYGSQGDGLVAAAAGAFASARQAVDGMAGRAFAPEYADYRYSPKESFADAFAGHLTGRSLHPDLPPDPRLDAITRQAALETSDSRLARAWGWVRRRVMRFAGGGPVDPDVFAITPRGERPARPGPALREVFAGVRALGLDPRALAPRVELLDRHPENDNYMGLFHPETHPVDSLAHPGGWRPARVQAFAGAVRTQRPGRPRSSLADVLAHEFGHAFDFAAGGAHGLVGGMSGEGPRDVWQVGALSEAPGRLGDLTKKYFVLSHPGGMPPGIVEGFAELFAHLVRPGYTPSQAYGFRRPATYLLADVRAEIARLAGEFPNHLAPRRRFAGGGHVPTAPKGGRATLAEVLASFGALRDGSPATSQARADGAEDVVRAALTPAVLARVPAGSRVVGVGSVGVALRTPAGDVLRLQAAAAGDAALAARQGRATVPGLFDVARPNIPAVLQPTAGGWVGKGARRVFVERLPYAEPIPDADWRAQADAIARLKASARASGYVFSDAHPGNVGVVNGRPYVVDPGAVLPAHAFASVSPTAAQGAPAAALTPTRGYADGDVVAPAGRRAQRLSRHNLAVAGEALRKAGIAGVDLSGLVSRLTVDPPAGHLGTYKPLTAEAGVEAGLARSTTLAVLAHEVLAHGADMKAAGVLPTGELVPASHGHPAAGHARHPFAVLARAAVPTLEKIPDPDVRAYALGAPHETFAYALQAVLQRFNPRAFKVAHRDLPGGIPDAPDRLVDFAVRRVLPAIRKLSRTPLADAGFNPVDWAEAGDQMAAAVGGSGNYGLALGRRGLSTRPLRRFAHGDLVTGGTPDKDSVPALLTPGEFVFTKQAAQRIGYGTLRHMNRHGELPQGFAGGGPVRLSTGGEIEDVRTRIREQERLRNEFRAKVEAGTATASEAAFVKGADARIAKLNKQLADLERGKAGGRGEARGDALADVAVTPLNAVQRALVAKVSQELGKVLPGMVRKSPVALRNQVEAGDLLGAAVERMTAALSDPKAALALDEKRFSPKNFADEAARQKALDAAVRELGLGRMKNRLAFLRDQGEKGAKAFLGRTETAAVGNIPEAYDAGGRGGGYSTGLMGAAAGAAANARGRDYTDSNIPKGRLVALLQAGIDRGELDLPEAVAKLTERFKYKPGDFRTWQTGAAPAAPPAVAAQQARPRATPLLIPPEGPSGHLLSVAAVRDQHPDMVAELMARGRLAGLSPEFVRLAGERFGRAPAAPAGFVGPVAPFSGRVPLPVLQGLPLSLGTARTVVPASAGGLVAPQGAGGAWGSVVGGWAAPAAPPPGGPHHVVPRSPLLGHPTLVGMERFQGDLPGQPPGGRPDAAERRRLRDLHKRYDPSGPDPLAGKAPGGNAVRPPAPAAPPPPHHDVVGATFGDLGVRWSSALEGRLERGMRAGLNAPPVPPPPPPPPVALTPPPDDGRNPNDGNGRRPPDWLAKYKEGYRRARRLGLSADDRRAAGVTEVERAGLDAEGRALRARAYNRPFERAMAQHRLDEQAKGRERAQSAATWGDVFTLPAAPWAGGTPSTGPGSLTPGPTGPGSLSAPATGPGSLTPPGPDGTTAVPPVRATGAGVPKLATFVRDWAAAHAPAPTPFLQYRQDLPLGTPNLAGANLRAAVEAALQRPKGPADPVRAALQDAGLKGTTAESLVQARAQARVDQLGGDARVSQATKAAVLAQEEDRVRKQLVDSYYRQIRTQDGAVRKHEAYQMALDRAAEAFRRNADGTYAAETRLLRKGDRAVGGRAEAEALVAQGKGPGGNAWFWPQSPLTPGWAGRGWQGVRDSFRRENGMVGQTALISVGGIVGGAVEPSQEAVKNAAVKGDASRVRAEAGLGGALSGAAMGAGIGMMFGGPGLVVGAVLGAGVGIANSLTEVNKAIREAKLADALTKLGTALNAAAGSVGGAGAVDFAEADKQFAAADAEIATKVRKQTRGYLWGTLSWGEASAKEAAAVRQREVRETYGGQAGAMVGLLTQRAEAVALRAPRDRAMDRAEAAALARGVAGENSLARRTAELRGVAPGVVEKEIADTIRAAQRRLFVQAEQDKARTAAEAAAVSLARLADAVANAAAALDRYDDRLAAAADAFAGRAGPGRAPDLSGGFAQLGTGTGREYAESAAVVRNALGAAADPFLASAGHADRLARALPAALGELGASPGGPDEVITGRARRLLLAQALPGTTAAEQDAAVKADPALAGLLAALTDHISRLDEGHKAEGGLARVLSRDAGGKTAEELRRAALAPYQETGERVTRGVKGFGDRYGAGLGEARQMAQAAGESGDRLAELRLGALRAAAEVRADRAGRAPADLLSVADLQGPFRARQERLVTGAGLGAGAAEDPAAIAARLAEVRQKMDGAVEAQRAAAGSPDRMAGAAKALDGLKADAAALQQALRHLANAGERTAAVQEKLAAATANRDSRLGYAEKYTMASAEQQLRMRRGQDLVGSLDRGRVGFADLSPEERRTALESLNDLGQARLASGRTAEGLKREALGGLPGALAPGQEGERRGLQDQFVALAEAATAAQAAVVRDQRDAHRDFLQGLKQLHDQFFARLGTNQAKNDLDAANAGLTRAKGDRGLRQIEQDQAGLLRRVGVTSNAGLEDLRKNKADLQGFFGVEDRMAALKARPDPFWGTGAPEQVAHGAEAIIDEAPAHKSGRLRQALAGSDFDQFDPETKESVLARARERIAADVYHKRSTMDAPERAARVNAIVSEEMNQGFSGTLGKLRKEQAPFAGKLWDKGVDPTELRALSAGDRARLTGALDSKTLDLDTLATRVKTTEAEVGKFEAAVRAATAALEAAAGRERTAAGALPTGDARDVTPWGLGDRLAEPDVRGLAPWGLGRGLAGPTGDARDAVPWGLNRQFSAPDLGAFVPPAAAGEADLGSSPLGWLLRGGRAAAGLAAGGPAFAPRGTDTVPAMLTPGEFVVNRESARANMALLQAVNSRRGPLALAGGGVAYLAAGGAAAATLAAAHAYNRDPWAEFRAETAGVNARDRARRAETARDPYGVAALAAAKGEGDARTAERDAARRAGLPGVWGFGLRGLSPEERAALQKEYDGLEFARQTPDVVGRLSVLRGQLGYDAAVGAAADKDRADQARRLVALRDRGAARAAGYGQAILRGALGLPGEGGQLQAAAAAVAEREAAEGRMFNDRFGRETAEVRRARVQPQQLRLAAGGVVPGAGGGDTVPALLTPGEFVFSRPAVAALGAGALARVHRFAAGGLVPGGAGGGAGAGPGAVGPIGLSAEARGALEAFAGQAKGLSAALGGFGAPAQALAQAVGAFTAGVEKLAGVLEHFPKEVTHTMTVNGEVVLNGAEVLAEVSRGVQKMVYKAAQEVVDREFERRLPDAPGGVRSEADA